MPKLTNAQINEVAKEMTKDGVPVRFLLNGCCLDITSGQAQKKGINVIHQIHYWNFSRETSWKIAKWLGARPVFSA